jgi:hypothetical protein
MTARSRRAMLAADRPTRSPVLTLSIIKADTGGFVGHSAMHRRMLDAQVAGTASNPRGALR